MPEHPDGLAAAKACATRGLCIFCEEPLAVSAGARARIICGGIGCRRIYMNAYKRDRRAGAQRTNIPPGWRVRWNCGCGRNYQHDSFRQRHRWKCLFAREAWPIVIVPRGVAG